MTRRFLPLLLGLGTVALLLAQVLNPARTLVYRDALPFAAAQNQVHQAALRAGALPEWDTSQYAGVPFLAAPPSQALYPPRLLAALLAGPTAATELLVLFHLLLAFVGGLWLGRELGLGRTARAALALTYLLSGPLLSLAENLPSLTGASWLPLSLAALLAARRARTDRGWLLAAAGLALPFYGGATQVVAWLLVAGCLIALWPDGRPGRERVGSTALLLGCAAALGAALLLPAASVYPETTRGELALVELGTWSFHPTRALELLVPFPLGLPFGDRADYLGPALEPRARELWSHTLFLGAIPLLLLVRAFGPVPRRLRLARALAAGVVLLGLVLAFGRHGPLQQLLARTPYRVFRYPEKHLLLVALAGACLVGVGAQALLHTRPWREPRRLLPLLAVPSVVLLSWPLATAWSGSLAEAIGRATPALAPQVVAVILAQLAALGVLALPGLGRRRREAALLIVLAATGLAVNHRLIHTGDARLATEPPPAVAWLRANAPELNQPLPPRVARVPSGAFGRAPNLAPSDARAAVMLMTLQGASARLYGLEGLQGMTGFRPKRIDALLRRGGADALARGAASIVIGPTGHHQAEVLADLDLGISLYRVPARPRVELLGGTVRRVTRPRPEVITLEVDCPTPAVLTVRDAWFPGWKAILDDGRTLPVVPADEAFLGVALPAGARGVTLRYRTPGLFPGLLLTLPAWLLVLVVLVTSRRTSPPRLERPHDAQHE